MFAPFRSGFRPERTCRSKRAWHGAARHLTSGISISTAFGLPGHQDGEHHRCSAFTDVRLGTRAASAIAGRTRRFAPVSAVRFTATRSSVLLRVKTIKLDSLGGADVIQARQQQEPRFSEFWLSTEQFERLRPLLPNKVRGVGRGDDLWVISGIIHVVKSGGRRVDAPACYGPRKTPNHRFVRWAAKGIWQEMFVTLAAAGGPPAEVLIDSTHMKAHRLAGGGKGRAPSCNRDQPRWPQQRTPRAPRRRRPPAPPSADRRQHCRP